MNLSICIATYNRGQFIGETLDSILGQMQPGVELVVVDGASPDNTPEIMAQYKSRHPEIRYFRESTNSGVDCDYDKAVGYAKGKYCWLMTDDDLLRPNAVASVLEKLTCESDLVVVNAEVKNADFSTTLSPTLGALSNEDQFELTSHDAIFQRTAQALSFIGCVIIRRSLWLSRNRVNYYGTCFIHVGVIFQSPAIVSVEVIVDPLITIRYGNAMWTPRGFEIWMFKWPTLIWSFSDFSDRAKATICPLEPWRQLKNLVLQRAVGGYSYQEYSKFLMNKVSGFSRIMPLVIAVTPAGLINALASLYCLVLNRRAISGVYDFARSRHAGFVSRRVARLLGV
jgi:glycosyltransferase involved in cell wall biosynthesis